MIPTPAVAFLTVKYGADAGIVISASHNLSLIHILPEGAEDGKKLYGAYYVPAVRQEYIDVYKRQAQAFCQILSILFSATTLPSPLSPRRTHTLNRW